MDDGRVLYECLVSLEGGEAWLIYYSRYNLLLFVFFASHHFSFISLSRYIHFLWSNSLIPFFHFPLRSSKMRSFTAAALILSSATSVSSHATFQQLWVDGVDQVSTCARLPSSNSPIQDASLNDMRCNAGSAAAASTCAVTGT